jgi:ATP-binding cassette subfamily C (CFTR/MRP) protein 1
MVLALTPINLAPAVTFAVYVIIAVFWKNKALLTGQAFTSTTLISLLTTHVVVFVQVLPTVIQCIASFDRIQEYCNYGSDPDAGNDTDIHRLGTESSINSSALEMDTKISRSLEKPVISFEGQNLGFHTGKPVVLKDLKVEIKRGGITAIVGPVGSGKSAFLNGILGEMVSIPTSLKVSERKIGVDPIAYCSQQPWLENGTIRQNVVGISTYDREWYATVKFACSLDADIEGPQKGDSTSVGSKGLNLSGGQKQRIVSANTQLTYFRLLLLDIY